MKLSRRQESTAPSGPETFRCNICGSSCTTPLESLSREVADCQGCGSTPRFRAVASVLTQELLGEPKPLSAIPEDKDLKGIGLSDWPGYAVPLAGKLNFLNTFLDRQPRLDVTAAQPAHAGSCDFVIASEVFEHVRPPVVAAMHNVRNMLKPKGFLLLTVPFNLSGHTTEHYPNLYDYELSEFQSRPVLINRTHSGKLEVFENPVFHGGAGLVLEMRLFSREGLMSSLTDAGFGDVRVVEGAREFGACWPEPYSLPVVARR